MAQQRREGYYWVKFPRSERWFILYFYPYQGWVSHDRASISANNDTPLTDDYFQEINENRISSPDEFDLCSVFRQISAQGNPFKYDPSTNVISVFDKAATGVRTLTATAGFDFDDMNKQNLSGD